MRNRRSEIFKDDIVSLRFAVRRGVERYQNDELEFKKRHNREDNIKMSRIAHRALDRMWELSLEQGWYRRARKARKNAVMYKTFGRRPWGIADDVLSWPSAYNWTPAKVRHLREPSGFKAMSRLADALIETESREPGCQCQWEAGDSPCRVHGEAD